MGGHRPAAWRGLRFVTGAILMGGLVAGPVAAHAGSALNPATAGGHAGAAPTTQSTATRVARVSPRTDGVAATAGSGSPFGVPQADSVGAASLKALQRAGATLPKSFNLPRWLPQRSTPASRRAAAQAHAAIAKTTPAPNATTATTTTATPDPVVPISASTPLGSGLRSEFGLFGLSDADDSLLYPDCNEFELCEEPPDPGVAVSATSVVESINELIWVVDRKTNDSRVMPNFDFFSLDNNQVTQSDPKVIFDTSRQRWLATEISSDCSSSYVHMAVSATPDPFGPWIVYRLVFPGRVVDFPGVGSAGGTVVIGMNTYGPDPASPDCLAPGDFIGGMLAVVDWSDLTGGVASLPVTTTKPDPSLFTWRPALTTTGDNLGRLIVAIDNGTDDSSDVGYATVTGTNANRNVTVSAVANLTQKLGLAAFRTPPEPRQPGDVATIENAVDGQPTDAIAAGSHLWFIATAPCTPTGDDTVRDCVRLTDLLTGATTAAVAVASDTTFSEKGLDLYMGGVGRSMDGSIYVVYSRSSASTSIDAWTTRRPPLQGAFSAPVELIPGGGDYSGTRWGDYVILAPDPAQPDAIWQAAEVPAFGGSWFTWLSRIRPAAFGPLNGSVRMNGGDEFAGDTFVDLQLTNPPDVALTVVRVANTPALANGVLSGGQTLPVATDQSWSLDIDRPENLLPVDGQRSVFVQWGDGLGHWSDVATDQIIVDTTAPTIGAVRAPGIGTSALLPSGSIPVDLTWLGGRDALSGLEGYDIEVSQDDNDWEDFGSTGGTHQAGRVQAGHRYQFRVRSFDRVGNVSDWAESPTTQISIVDDTSKSIAYDAGWRRSTSRSAYQGGTHGATKAGSTATFSFTGRAFAIATPASADRGTVQVFVDGKAAGTLNESQAVASAARIGYRRTVSAGHHTVRLVASGTGRVEFDAVIVLR